VATEVDVQPGTDRSDAPAQPQAGRFTFELTAPVQLGTPDDFLRWVNRKFDAGIPSVAELGAQVPGPLQAVVKSLLDMRITIDAFVVQTGPDGHCRFAATVDFGAAPPRLGNVLELDRIGFRVERRGSTAAATPAA
jgi:hypothetical protein